MWELSTVVTGRPSWLGMLVPDRCVASGLRNLGVRIFSEERFYKSFLSYLEITWRFAGLMDSGIGICALCVSPWLGCDPGWSRLWLQAGWSGKRLALGDWLSLNLEDLLDELDMRTLMENIWIFD